MRSARSLRPSPAMLVALTALVFALSGAAVAATKIGTSDIKSKAVTTAKIDKKAVTGNRIAADAVKSGKIKDEGVKRENIAADAINGAKVEDDSLSDKELSDYEILGDSFVRVTATEAATLAAAQAAAPETSLASRGPFELYAKCFRDTTTGEIRGEIYSRTSVDGAIQEGVDDLPATNATLLNTGTTEEDREIDTQSNTTANTGGVGEDEGFLMAPDATAFNVLTYIAVKQGTFPTGNGAFGDGNVCLFGGTLTG